MAKHWLTALGGMLSVLPLLTAMTIPGGMAFILLAPLPLFLVGLGQGERACWIAGLVAVALWCLIGGLPVAIGALATMIAPIWWLVRQALRARTTQEGEVEWYPAGLLVGWITALGLGWFLACLAMLASVHGLSGVEDALRQDLTTVLGQLVPDVEASRIDDLTGPAAAWGMGISAATWMVLLLALNGVLAQGLLVRFGHAIRPTPSISELELPAWPTWFLAACAVLAVATSGAPAFIARNLVPVALVPFFFGGLAVVHNLCRRFKARGLLLFVFYMALFIWALVLPPALAALGLIDQWAGFRRRLPDRRTGQEEE